MQVCAAAVVDTGLPTARTCSNALHDVVIVSAVRTPMCKASCAEHGSGKLAVVRENVWVGLCMRIEGRMVVAGGWEAEGRGCLLGF